MSIPLWAYILVGLGASLFAAMGAVGAALINQGVRIRSVQKQVDEHDEIINQGLEKKFEELMRLRDELDK